MDSEKNSSSLVCSFCGKAQRDVRKLVAGPSVYICDECIGLCGDIVKEEVESFDQKESPEKRKKPSEIKSILDEYIVGQDRAKKVLSVAVYNHYKRIESGLDTTDVEIQKSNILLLGPTGSGKTLLAKTLAKILQVPFVIADATGLTEAGYVGEDVETIMNNLLSAADGDIELAQRGIVYIDEIDKITRKGDGPSITRDVSGEGVQQALLKLIEGTMCNVSSKSARKNAKSDFLKVDTSQILFICGGAFSGLEKLVEARISKKSVGFHLEKTSSVDKNRPEDYFSQVLPEDLIRFGLIPEFVGRLPVFASLSAVDKDTLVEIMVRPKDALVTQYKALFEYDGVALRFTEEALEEVAKEALKQKTGARGLRRILEKAMLNVMYEIPGDVGVREVVFNKRSVQMLEKPLVVMQDSVG